MSLTRHLIARAGADERSEEEAVPVRLIAKDRGARSSFAVPRAEMSGTSIEMPQDEQQMAAMPRRRIHRQDDEKSDQEAQASRQTADAAEEEQTQARRQAGDGAEEEEAQARRQAGDEAEEEGAQARRQDEHPVEEEGAQLRRALRRAETEMKEPDDPAPLRRQETSPEEDGEAQAQRNKAPEKEQLEARPLHRTTPDGLPDEVPSEELRHDTAGAALGGAPGPMRAIPISESAPRRPGPTAPPPVAGAADAQSPPAPIDPGLTFSMPAADRPHVMIDQIDVVVAETGGQMPVAHARTAPNGARALLASRYVKWR